MEAAKTAGSSPMAKKDAPAFKTILNSPYQLKWCPLIIDCDYNLFHFQFF